MVMKMDIELAKKIMRGGLGKAELEIMTSYNVPLYWLLPENGRQRVKNGTACFLDTGSGPFAATAAHVVGGWREDRVQRKASAPRLAGLESLSIDFAERLIDEDRDIDIATFPDSRRRKSPSLAR